MRREWEPEDLIASWTLIEPDRELIGRACVGAGRVDVDATLVTGLQALGVEPREARSMTQRIFPSRRTVGGEFLLNLSVGPPGDAPENFTCLEFPLSSGHALA